MSIYLNLPKVFTSSAISKHLDYAKEVAMYFGSTYACEQLFSKIYQKQVENTFKLWAFRQRATIDNFKPAARQTKII